MEEQQFRELIAITSSTAAKVDSIGVDMKYLRDNDIKQDEKIEKVQQKMNYWIGGATVAGTGVGFFAKYLLSKIGIHLD